MNDEKNISEMSEEELVSHANDAVASKNRQLLEELKKHKNLSSRLQSELDAANAELKEMKLTQPVNAILEELFTVPSDIALVCAEKFVRFELEGGKVVIRDPKGAPIKIKPRENEEEREANFNGSDLRYIFDKTGELDSILMGSRATGTRGPAVSQRTIVKPETDFTAKLGLN